jgi:hypothetical protein
VKLNFGFLVLPLRHSLASASVVEARVALAGFSPWKSRSPLRPGPDGSLEPSFALKLFIEAKAAICLPSTEKCSSDSDPRRFL